MSVLLAPCASTLFCSRKYISFSLSQRAALKPSFFSKTQLNVPALLYFIVSYKANILHCSYHMWGMREMFYLVHISVRNYLICVSRNNIQNTSVLQNSHRFCSAVLQQNNVYKNTYTSCKCGWKCIHGWKHTNCILPEEIACKNVHIRQNCTPNYVRRNLH